jgi:hypothetical protein
VDYQLIEQLFTRFSAQLVPSPEQTLTIISTNICKRLNKPAEEAVRDYLRSQDIAETEKLSEKKFLMLFTDRFGALTDQDLRVVFGSFNLDVKRRLLASDLYHALVAYAHQRAY